MNTYKAKNFVDNIMPNIYVDRSFQRKTCWSDDDGRKYILSLNWGRAPQLIITADISSGLKRSQTEMDLLGQSRYEKASKENCDRISLDGQNRPAMLKRMFEDDLTLSGTFIDADGKELNVENKLFSKLPIRLQDKLKDMEVREENLKDCLYSDLHNIFVQINSGVPLNDQEKRNAIDTYVSEFFREKAESEEFAGIWKKINGFSDTDIKRSFDAEWTARAYIATLRDYNCSALDSRKITEFYNLGKGKLAKNVPEYAVESRSRFHKIFKGLKNLIDSQNKGSVPQKIWWLCVLVSEKVIVDDQRDINNYEKLYDILRRIDTQLINDSVKSRAADVEEWEKSGRLKGEEPSYTDYYVQWASDPKSARSRNKRMEAFFNVLWVDSEFNDLLERSKKQLVA